MTTVFVDTNVFVYAVDRTEPAKQLIAQRVLDDLVASRRAVGSCQVVGEYVCTMSSKLRFAMSRTEAVAAGSRLAKRLPLLAVDDRVAGAALRASDRYDMHYWDAQIWATAKVHGVDVILTEDCPCAELEGVRYVNPFAEGFEGV
ncbi:MAG: PIN domain-containing protein [Coriobacteriales bacterium]|nr:PIN domain-containing protein [Coriobacteriales bacterium]